jgi:hypothetical protein
MTAENSHSVLRDFSANMTKFNDTLKEQIIKKKKAKMYIA